MIDIFKLKLCPNPGGYPIVLDDLKVSPEVLAKFPTGDSTQLVYSIGMYQLVEDTDGKPRVCALVYWTEKGGSSIRKAFFCIETGDFVLEKPPART